MKKLTVAAALLCCVLQPTAWANPTTEIDKLFASMGLEQTFEQALEQAKEHLSVMQLPQDPSQAPLVEAIQQFLTENPSWESLLPEISRIVSQYSEAVSDSELRELAELYTSEVGQKSLQQLSELMAQGAQLDAAQMQENQKALLELLSKEMERLGLEF